MSLIKVPLPDSADPNFLRTLKYKLETVEPVELPVYTAQQLAALTAANYAGYVVRCSNGNAGAECIAYCDGFRWKVIELGSNIAIE